VAQIFALRCTMQVAINGIAPDSRIVQSLIDCPGAKLSRAYAKVYALFAKPQTNNGACTSFHLPALSRKALPGG